MKLIKQSIRHLLAFALIASTMTYFGAHAVSAQEKAVCIQSKTEHEFLNKQQAGLEVYELLDENGTFLGYYEPYSESNPEPKRSARYGSSVNWTVPANKVTYGENQYTLSSGAKIQVNISQSRTGTSYLTFFNRKTNSPVRFTTTKVTNGWNGTIILNDTFKTSTYSFGIENASKNSITYTGTYSL